LYNSTRDQDHWKFLRRCFAIFAFVAAHSPTREPIAAQGLNLLWNKLAVPQDTHDQESNVPFVPL
jgi:hypothetical protein